MITFSELLERAKSERIAIHTPKEKQAKALLSELDKRGYEWFIGRKITTGIHYEIYKQNTCYDFNNFRNMPKKIMYGPLDCYQELNFTIIEFKDIDFKEK